MKRINCIYLCLLFMGVFAVQPTCSQEKAFKPVTFEKEHSVKVNGTPKEVFTIIARPERFKGTVIQRPNIYLDRKMNWTEQCFGLEIFGSW